MPPIISVPEVNTLSVVFVGSFNPAIFHPEWFAKNGIISAVDLEGQDVEVVHNELSKFSIQWASFEVTHDRFIAHTSDMAQSGPLRDLLASTFNILKHTPLKQMGFNRKMLFQVPDEEVWHQVGDALAPKDIWHQFIPQRAGLLKLVIKSPRPDDYHGSINIEVSPVRSDQIGFGVQINVNNHFDIDDISTSEALNILSSRWDDMSDWALKVSHDTLNKIVAN